MRFAAKILIPGPDSTGWIAFMLLMDLVGLIMVLFRGRDKRVKEEILGLKFDPNYVTCMYLYFPAYGYP